MFNVSPVKYILAFLTICLLSVVSAAQTPEIYHRARVELGGKGIQGLVRAGIDMTHVHFHGNQSFESDFSEWEIAQMQDAGYQVEILIRDMAAYYANPDRESLRPHEHFAESRSGACDSRAPSLKLKAPVNFELGSMGGYYTYEEIWDQLELMHMLYPDLISLRKQIGNFKTSKGRSLFYVKISDNASLDEQAEPKVLHTALHHAREPISVSQMIYFMWTLLENYHSDEMVRHLVDQNEIYFIPVVNPDGYIYNQTTNPQGGGMHRKNMRTPLNPNDGCFGVDLNRNYDYFWGYDNVGSSPEPCSETYRGPSANSEPEVRAVQWLCQQVPFRIALNFHSYGDALLYPYGFTNVPSEDQHVFESIGRELAKSNGFEVGRSFNVGSIEYYTNGTSDDWMYGENILKQKIYAFTPEIGEEFWPPRSEIVPLCRDMLYMNLISVGMLGSYGVLDDMTSPYCSTSDVFEFGLEQLGQSQGSFTVTLEAITDNIVSMGTPAHLSLPAFSRTEGAIPFELRPNTTVGEEIRFAVHLNHGGFVTIDTLTKFYMGDKKVIMNDACDDMSKWVPEGTATWGVDETDYFSAPSSISDSPGANYVPNAYNNMRIWERLDLRGAHAAYLTFRGKWAIEPRNDFVKIQASTNGIVFDNLCGRYTKTYPPTALEPVYDGFQAEWITEVVDLSNYLGEQIFIRLAMQANERDEYDGFYMDDLSVVVFSLPTGHQDAILRTPRHQVFPNPSDGAVFLEWEGDFIPTRPFELQVYNTLGQVVYTADLASHVRRQPIELSSLAPGVYTYRMSGAEVDGATGKVIIK